MPGDVVRRKQRIRTYLIETIVRHQLSAPVVEMPYFVLLLLLSLFVHRSVWAEREKPIKAPAEYEE